MRCVIKPETVLELMNVLDEDEKEKEDDLDVTAFLAVCPITSFRYCINSNFFNLLSDLEITSFV
jgi:hypothetical protein